jgi:HAMP domain-containing protein
MSTSQFIALAAVVIPSATALLVAYWHRKQLRQIEEFRRDACVGLQPPPSRLWAFAKSHRDLLAGVGVALFLADQLAQTGPVTRWTVLIIALDVAAILFIAIAHLLFRMLGVIERILRNDARMVRTTERTLGILERTVPIVTEVVDDARSSTSPPNEALQPAAQKPGGG